MTGIGLEFRRQVLASAQASLHGERSPTHHRVDWRFNGTVRLPGGVSVTVAVGADLQPTARPRLPLPQHGSGAAHVSSIFVPRRVVTWLVVVAGEPLDPLIVAVTSAALPDAAA